jgi:uncharacterized protein CbrC (UPF0167 family)
MSPDFRYFERPHQFSTYRETARQCDLCGQSRPGYEGPFSGGGDAEFVCEESLVMGSLVGEDLSTNAGDRAALERQLRKRHPAWAREHLQEQIERLTAELEQSTPHMMTWQSFFWPAHCGDYCRYIKEVGQKDLARLAPDSDGIAFLAAHSTEITDLAQAQDVWETTRPDAPTDNRVAYSVGVYLFQCLSCQEYIILWDGD